MPPDQRTPDILDYFLAGHSPSAIAHALKLPIGRLLETLKTPDARQAIADFEELLTIQARIAALAARIPAISTLQAICTGDFPPAERRRAATELMRSASQPVAQVKSGNQTPPTDPDSPRHTHHTEPGKRQPHRHRDSPAESSRNDLGQTRDTGTERQASEGTPELSQAAHSQPAPSRRSTAQTDRDSHNPTDHQASHPTSLAPETPSDPAPRTPLSRSESAVSQSHHPRAP